jgi:D-arabinose 1-dehydrogenase-like Zn-dependent alcohol dehydrogenase
MNTTMHAVVVNVFGQPLALQELLYPKARSRQVLVKPKPVVRHTDARRQRRLAA